MGYLTKLIIAQILSASLTHSVKLSWQAPKDTTVVHYNVYRGSVCGNYPFSKNVGDRLTVTDTSVVSGKTYAYAVTSVDMYGIESVKSNCVKVTIP